MALHGSNTGSLANFPFLRRDFFHVVKDQSSPDHLGIQADRRERAAFGFEDCAVIFNSAKDSKVCEGVWLDGGHG